MSTAAKRPATATATETKPTAYWCRVHHLDMDAENKDRVPITVCVNDPSRVKVLRPWEKVVLEADEIRALRDAATTTRILIPMDSALYQASDPINEARKHYPGHTIERDRRTGAMYAVRNQPRFLVEIVEPWQPSATSSNG